MQRNNEWSDFSDRTKYDFTIDYDAGKKVVVYIPETQEAELMPKLFDLVSGDINEIIKYLE